MSEQLTHIYLLNVPLENDYKHTLYFTSKSTQLSYFTSKKVKEYTNCSYQRKDQFVRIPEHYETLASLGCNYLIYHNAVVDKWFYSFITDMKYVNDGYTDIFIETDCIQTWFFDYNVKPSFVEREHVDNDAIGSHTVPEGLEIGEYICSGTKFDTPLTETALVLGTTVSISGENVQGGNYNGIYSALKYYSGQASDINDFIRVLTEGSESADFKGGKADAINCIFMAPKFLCGNGVTFISNSEAVNYFESIYGKPTTLSGYTPRNNKLFTFPYRYLMVANNNGGTAIYHYELFSSEACNFKIEGALTPGCSIRLIPKNYKQLETNNEEGLNLGKYPVCNWNTDVYTNWLTQNSVNIAMDLVSGGLQVVGGIGGAIATGGIGSVVAGGIASGGIEKIASTLAQVYTHSFTPPQSKGNINCGDVITASDKNTFTYYQMNIKPEYARIIDEYFDMFGYKVNRVKTPNKAHRSRYWYTKTIDVNIDGAIPNKDMQVIKNCYNNGITFWRNASEIQNYSLSNSIYKG